RYEKPLLALGVEVVPGVNCVCWVARAGGDYESLFLTCLPGINQVAVTPSAFVAEIAGVNSIALPDQSDPVLWPNFATLHGFVATVPDAEDDAAFGQAVDLHPEIAAVPAAGHVKSPNRILNRGDLAVKGVDIREVGYRVEQVNRGGVAARLRVE